MELRNIKPIEIHGQLKEALELNKTISPGGHSDASEVLIRNLESRVAFFNMTLKRPDISPRSVNILANLRERITDFIRGYNHDSGNELLSVHCNGCGAIINNEPFKTIDDLFFDAIARRPINMRYPATKGKCK